LAIGRIIEEMTRKELGYAKKDFIVYRSYSETAMKPLPGYD
jgi:hypothetical protein